MSWKEPYGRVVVVGSANTDLVIRAPNIPAPGQTVLGSDFLKANGGKGANQAVAAARLGAHVTFVGRVGADQFGRDAIDSYAEAGIDTRYIAIDSDTSTGVGLIVVDEAGENAIVVASGANGRLDPVDVSRAARAIRLGDILLLQLETPLASTERALQLARENKTPVILNPAPAGDVPAELLRRIDVLTPNEHEVTALAAHLGTTTDDVEEAAAALLATGVGTIVVTLGPAGTMIVDSDGSRTLDAPRVEAVDTTGAGDAFNGALAVELAEGRELDEAVAAAQRVAAVSVTRPGAQPSLPTREEVESLLADEEARADA